MCLCRRYALQQPGAPTLQVFNDKTKHLQRERAATDAAASKRVDYLRDEVASRLCERLLVCPPSQCTHSIQLRRPHRISNDISLASSTWAQTPATSPVPSQYPHPTHHPSPPASPTLLPPTLHPRFSTAMPPFLLTISSLRTHEPSSHHPKSPSHSPRNPSTLSSPPSPSTGSTTSPPSSPKSTHA